MVMMRWVAVLLLAFPATGLAETEPEFYLCSPYVEISAVGEQTDLGWPVYVKLTEVGTTSLEAFTEANTGKMIRILVDSREFSRATIWPPIPSGNLHGTFSSQEVATDWQQTLTGNCLQPHAVHGIEKCLPVVAFVPGQVLHRMPFSLRCKGTAEQSVGCQMDIDIRTVWQTSRWRY